MKIREITVTPVAFRDPPLLNAAGVHEPWALRTIVEIHTDEGLTGLGETYGDLAHLTKVREAASAITGLDIYAQNQIYKHISAVTGDAVSDLHGLTGVATKEKSIDRVYSPFEVASLDIQGKTIGRPVCDLLGGPVRDSVPYSAYLFYKWPAHPGTPADRFGAALTPEEIVTQAHLLINEYGFQSIKLKGGVFPPDQEIDAILALRDAFPTHPLRLDPNALWSIETSIRVAHALDGTSNTWKTPHPAYQEWPPSPPKPPCPSPPTCA
ncbi:hypothetical protein GCM10009556_034320 [Acrocarpospora pleiomorpha]